MRELHNYITLNKYCLFVITLTVFVLRSDAAFRSSTTGFCQKVVKIPKVIRRTETYLALDSVPVECENLDTDDELCKEYKKNVKRRIVTKQIFQSRSIRTCCLGYYKYSRFCLPHCEPDCENGLCTDPNICTCNEGYKNSSFYYKCVPDCGNSCINGECTAPNVCSCSEGYHKNKDGVCEPTCENPCLNGTCVGPNTCECNHGFTLNREQNNVCEPVCSKECKFGTCVAPEQCECLDGYSKNSTNECHPICDFCENGHCVSPNRCECHGDFKTIVQEKEHRNITLCLPKCNPGYKFANNETFECVPDCGICVNGTCVSPGKCECWKGYVNDERVNLTTSYTVCKPFCTDCYEPNECVSPQNCSCHPNYRTKKVYLHELNIEANTCQLYCFPLCEEKSRCVEGNQCVCIDGFHNGKNGCEKSCEAECIFGECENGVCVCEPGFKMASNSTYNCEPYCNVTCKNGHCVDGNACECYEGYTLHDNGTECVAECEKSCINGTCFEPNMCECNKGYRKINYENDHVCVPVCNEDYEEDAVSIEGDTGCLHGICIAPNVCQCHDGYELSSKHNFTCILKNNTDDCVNCYSIEKLPKKISLRTTFIIIFALLLLVAVASFTYVKFRHHSRNINEKGFGLSFRHLVEDSIECKQKDEEPPAAAAKTDDDFNDYEELRF